MELFHCLQIARTWKQPRCPSTDEWIRRLWYIYTMDYYSPIKRNTFESVLMRWMNLEPIIEWSKSERERQILYVNTYTRNLDRWYWWNDLQGSNGDTDIKNRLLDTVGQGEGRMIWENSPEMYTWPNSQWKFDVWHKEPKAGALWQPGGME